MATTANLLLTLLEVGGGSPEITVNDALNILDLLTPYPRFKEVKGTNPASMPGSVPIVDPGVYFVYDATTPGGAWAGQGKKMAIRYNGQWIFLPTELAMFGFVEKDNNVAVNAMRLRTATTANTFTSF